MHVQVIRKKIMNRIWESIKDYFYDQRVLDSTIIQNLNYDHVTGQKKAIICYLTYSHYVNWENTSSGRTQPFEILAIVKILAGLGFSIDVIGCNDLRAIAHVDSKQYDLIFGFGETFYQLVQQQPWAVSVLYMTEQHPDFSYREEQKRVDYFNKRRSKQLKVSRSGKFYKKHHLDRLYSEVIVMGEVENFLSYYSKPYTIFPTGLKNLNYTFKTKPYASSRKHFLWLGSPGAAIHKGLDLLLDIFSKRDDLVLHIGGIGDEDKQKLDFPSKSNIIDHGFITVKSDFFLELVEQCSFIVLPSCSEACATSVATGMLHGLIPVVMKDAGFNRLGNNAIFLSDFGLDYLNARFDELVSLSPQELEAMSRSAHKFAQANFIIQAFNASMSQILDSITAAHNLGCAPTLPSVIAEQSGNEVKLLR
jgi:hypothetical protein